MERNAKGQFIKGNKEGMSSTAVARARQLVSAEVRHANAEKRKALRDLLISELGKDSGGGMTKAEWLVAKCLDNHAKGKLTFKDLKYLQDLLGESVQNINLTSEGAGLIIGFKKAEND